MNEMQMPNSESTAPDTTWPSRLEEVNADRLIVCGAHHAIHLDAWHHVLYAQVPWNDGDESAEKKRAIRRWAEAIGATVSAAQYVALLVEVQARSRDQADALARLIWQYTEMGDALIEPLWDYLAERGVKPDPVYDEARKAAHDWFDGSKE